VSKPREAWHELMLEVRENANRSYGLPYAYLVSVTPEGDSLVMAFSSHQVTVHGNTCVLSSRCCWIIKFDTSPSSREI
jgi:hypothetical protein